MHDINVISASTSFLDFDKTYMSINRNILASFPFGINQAQNKESNRKQMTNMEFTFGFNKKLHHRPKGVIFAPRKDIPRSHSLLNPK